MTLTRIGCVGRRYSLGGGSSVHRRKRKKGKNEKARNCVQHFLHFLSAFLIGFFSFGLHNFSSDYGDIIKLCRNV